MLRIVQPGPLALFQDAGRFGFLECGVGTSGVFDRHAAAQANRALGNPPEAPVIEIVLGPFEAEVTEPTHVVVTGAEAELHIERADGTRLQASTFQVVRLHRGDRFRLGSADRGLRFFLAVSGGMAAPEVLGSCASDRLSRIGPPPLTAGDLVAFGPCGSRLPTVRHVLPVRSLPAPGRSTALRVILGPRTSWVTEASLARCLRGTYAVSATSDRVGMRLEGGPPLERAVFEELPSEGMVRGAIQVPPDGMPVIFGPDHPVTGGYPVIGVLNRVGCDLMAQLAPGDRVRFFPVSLEEAAGWTP